MNSEVDLKAIAHSYRRMGLSIIPVKQNKLPLLDSWKIYQENLPSTEEIESWWSKWPQANIAMVTGKISGIVALDIDKKHNRSSSEFSLPTTACARSGSGGEHFFFKYPGPIMTRAAICGEGVDIRADGGYILLSPSRNDNGQYEWMIPMESKNDLSDMPTWLLKIVQNNSSDHKWLSGKDGVSEGLRNETAASLAGKIMKYMDPQLWESLGWEQLCIWNRKNAPPLPERELRSIWMSIGNYHKDKLETSSKTDYLKFHFTSLDELLREPEEEINWVIDNLLPAGGFSIVVAKPKVGKSTLARQAGLSVSKGEPFLGKNTIKGPVLYVSLEEKRSEVKKHFQIMGANGTEDLGVYVGSIPEDANKWLLSEVKNKKPILVIIDTLFKFAQVTDVNDYSRVLRALDPLLSLAREQSTHVMCIHHARKSPADGADGALGSTAIFGSVDTAIILKRTENKRTVETQQRYGTDLEPTILVFDPESKMTVLGGTKEEDDTKEVARRILDFLKTAKEPVSEAVIDEEIDGRTVFKRKALRELVAGEHVNRTGGGRKGDPFLYACTLVPDIYTEQAKQESW